MAEADGQTGGSDKLLQDSLPTRVSLPVSEEPRSPPER